MKTWHGLILLAAAGAGTAWWLGRSNEPAARAKTAVPTLESRPTPAAAPSTAATTPTAPVPTSLPPDLRPKTLRSECERVLAITSPAQRQLAFARLLSETRDEAALREILDVFAAQAKDGKRHGAELSAFWSELMARDPKAAVAFSERYNSDDPAWQAGVARRLAYEWALKDPQAAISWLAGNEKLTGRDLDGATLSLLSGYAGRDVAAATTYALGIIRQDDPLFGDTAFILSSAALQKGGVDGLLAWFDGLPDEQLKQRLFPSVSNRLESTSREQRAQWLAAQAAMPYRNDQAYRDFVGGWAEEDPAAALGWVLALPPSPKDGSTVGLGYAVFPWLERDAAGFTAHYRSLPPARQQEIVRTIQQITKDPKFPDRKRLPGLAFLESVK